MRTTGVDVSVFSLGGGSFLGDLKSAEMRADTEFADGTSVAMEGTRPVARRRSAEVTAELLSTGGASGRVTGLDLSALTLDGVSSLGNLRSMRFDGFVRQAEGAGASEVWKYPVAVRKDYRCRLELLADSGGPFETGRGYGSLASLSLELAFQLNGVDFQLPMIVRDARHTIREGDVQVWTVDLWGQAPVTGAYPTAPTGTGNLLAAAVNAPGVGLAFEMASRAVGGMDYAGTFLVRDFGFEVNAGSVVVTRYRYVSQGAVTGVVTS